MRQLIPELRNYDLVLNEAKSVEPTGKEKGITKIGKDSYPTAEQAEADLKRLCKSEAKPKGNP
jgi:hypothetical protein